jgi:protein-S-isoprenylcysteine O-methyltransferase Ste14
MLPGLVTVVVPAALLLRAGDARLFWQSPAPLAIGRLVGGLALAGMGLQLVVQTARLLASEGDGTLAPWDATRRLVVRGPYRRVRNPMISGVFAILLGEAILAGAAPLWAWLLGAVALNAVYIPLLEEPGLERRFGDDYRVYRRHVPRWLPRRDAWTPPWETPVGERT